MKSLKGLEIIERTIITFAAFAALFPLYQYYSEADDRARERIVREAMLATTCSDSLEQFKGTLSKHILTRNANDDNNTLLVLNAYQNDKELTRRLRKISSRISYSNMQFLFNCSRLGYTTVNETKIIDQIASIYDLVAPK